MSSNPVSRDEVATFLRELLAQMLSVEPEAVGDHDRFSEDLQLDSLALVDVADEIESEFGERTVDSRFDDDDLAELSTVAEAVDYIVGRIG